MDSNINKVYYSPFRSTNMAKDGPVERRADGLQYRNNKVGGYTPQFSR